MVSSWNWSVVVGAILLGGCAASAQGGAADRSDMMYFQARESSQQPADARQSPGPFDWSRVDARFHLGVDELGSDIGDWTRAGGRSAGAAPVLDRLAETLDSLPRAGGERAVGVADAIRVISGALVHDPMDAVDQRRKVREALLLTSRQLAADARGDYATDPNVSRSVANLRRVALSIPDHGPDADVAAGVVAAHDAIHSFEIALAHGTVQIPSG